MKRLITILTSIMVLSLSSSFAQYVTKGVVVDNNNVPVIGAAVLQVGTSNGTATGLNGEFILTVPSASTVLVISFLGYETVKIPADQATKIVLKDDTQFLEEVLVIGYGQVKKSDATGSVLAITADAKNRIQAVTPNDLLMGKTAGLQVSAATGEPGAPSSIRIRGGSSLSASNDPLIVIDGVPIANDGVSGMNNAMALVNPNDIATCSVLKDASATAIYGARASNGVIIITTKKGSRKDGVVKVTYDANISISNPREYLDVLTASEYRGMIADIYGTTSEAYTHMGIASTNWQKEIYRTAVITDHSLGIQGMAKNMPYRASIGYTLQEGILKGTDMNRVTGTLGLSPSFFNNTLKLNLNAKGLHYVNNFGYQGAIGGAVSHDPTQPVYWTEANEGYFGGIKKYFTWFGADGNPNTMASTNPVAGINETYNVATTNWFVGNAQFDYIFPFLPALRANLNLAYDMADAKGDNNIKNKTHRSYHASDNDGTGQRNHYTQLKKNRLLEFYLNYKKEYGKHSIDAMGGYSWQHFYKEGTNLVTAYRDRSKIKSTNEYATEYFLVSFFGRINYVYDDRYMLTATLRDDGTSRFADHWGLFPSVAAAWNISNEDFLKGNKIMSDLKIRLSYGITGQQDLNSSDYPYLATYEYGKETAQYQFGNEFVTTSRPSGYDASLKWEETTTYNIGVDYGFLEDRIYGNIDAYFRQTNDLINYIPVAAGTNLTNYLTTNIGSLENKGIEFSINAKPIVSKSVTWELGFNITWQDTKITKLTATEDPTYAGVKTGGISGGVGNTIQIHSVGYAPNSFYVYEQVYNSEGKPIEGLYVDQDNNGIINSNDLVRKYKPTPDYYMGFTSKLYIKNFDFSMSWRASLGNYVFNNVLSQNSGLSILYTNNFLINTLAKAYETGFMETQYFSSYFLENASFLRCDNITLGYTFKFKKSGDVRTYLTAQNPILITKYSGLDPEVSGGIDNNVYPRPYSIILGINLNF